MDNCPNICMWKREDKVKGFSISLFYTQQTVSSSQKKEKKERKKKDFKITFETTMLNYLEELEPI